MKCYQCEMRKRGKVRTRGDKQHDADLLLDILLPLDRGVVELYMRIYNIPCRDRHVIRAQQRHLHEGLRELEVNARGRS